MLLVPRRRLILALLMLFTLVLPSWARSESEADVAMRLRQLMTLIHQHSLAEVSDASLVGGAMESLQRTYQAPRVSNSVPLERRLHEAVAGRTADWDQVERVAVQGMLQKLNDRWAAYLSPEAYRGMRERSYATAYSGIGVTLFRETPGAPLVLCQPQADTPGHRAGLQGGDQLLTLNGQSLASLTENEVRAQLQAEPGTVLELGIMRDGRPLTVSVTCASIPGDFVHSQLLREGNRRVAYIQVGTFATSTPGAVAQAISELDPEALVLDLRNNGGGQVNAAVRLCSLFLKPGTEITSVHRKSGVDVLRALPAGPRFDGPLVVLLNENSASASELTAGALHDHDRALLVGHQSFGKGAVQRILPLADGSALKITTAHYRTPSGQSIEGRGLVPDVSAETALRWVGTLSERDEQLQVALDCATRSLTAQR